MNEDEQKPIAQSVLDRYKKKKEEVGYPFLDWSARILTFLAFISLILCLLNVFVILNAPNDPLHENTKALSVALSIASGVLSFILLKGLSSACFLLLDLWKSRNP
jgi:hypothetical protein